MSDAVLLVEGLSFFFSLSDDRGREDDDENEQVRPS